MMNPPPFDQFMKPELKKEIDLVNRIDAVKMILKSLHRLLGMRISLVARIESGSWTACAVSDQAKFGLGVGDQLDLSTTY